MRTWTICFDLDDTLIANTYKYHRPIWRCGMIISQALGYKSAYPLNVLELNSKIDQEMVAAHGYGTERFPQSWVKTYETLAEKAGVQPDDKVRSQLRNAASRFKYGPFELYPGARDALILLRDGGHELHLITAGDERLQDRKIASVGIRPLFDKVTITGVDKSEALAAVASEGPEKAMMVGDSKKSDIKPAKALGMMTVWVPSQTWTFANADIEADHTIASVSELPALLGRLGLAKQK